MDWVLIAQAGFLILLLVFVGPAMWRRYKDGPKGTMPEWLNASWILGLVMLFVLLLVMINRR